ncbi:hypothetical protein H0921_07605 [thermophilic bacterium 2918]|jgi:hypothetical protein|uniref:Uncharacterized protein n=1 Tax=Thermogemmata fonticola TaxID=2755323 RepID=A0A7V8VDF8_9BACT|nr:hypothetical protein [Thermogemmata fonticola]
MRQEDPGPTAQRIGEPSPLEVRNITAYNTGDNLTVMEFTGTAAAIADSRTRMPSFSWPSRG